MKHTNNILASALFAAALPAFAEDLAVSAPPVVEPPAEYTFMESIKTGTPMTSFRLRYETVDQEPSTTFTHDARALTLRSLIGWQTAPFHNFSVGVQVINVTKLDDDFNDRANNLNQPGKSSYPVVVDPDITSFNQLYLDWTGIRNTRVRLGRQSLKLDNVRFIGNIEYRQVMQVFDGVSVENKTIPDVELYGAFFTRNRNVNTDLKPDNTGILHAMYRISPSESLVGYGYFYNQEHLAVASDGSNKTFGLRLDGTRKINDDWKVLYTAEYAKQDDLGNSKNRTVAQGQIDAHYYKIGAGAGYGNWWARVDQELLSSNGGNYAFQTPLGTNHLFQGWVDKFLTTPKHGMRDTFVSAGGKLADFTLMTEYHWFYSDQDFTKVTGGTGDKYGTEWDVSVLYTYNKNLSAKFEYGTYKEDDQYLATASRIRDTDKLWLTALYTF